ncbi:hypothetical protein ES703_56793 [subsurface metagenome]
MNKLFKILIPLLLILGLVLATGCDVKAPSTEMPPVAPPAPTEDVYSKTEEHRTDEDFTRDKTGIVLENVPLVCQEGWLDCGLTSRAMLLGYFDTSITYHKSMYYSGNCYGFGYYPNTLYLGFPCEEEEDYEWLASLYGLSYERIVPAKTPNKEDAWDEYIDRIWSYLQEGVPVQTCWSWSGREEGGKIYTRGGFRPYWWEGITRENRPEMHYIVVVGLDKSEGVIYLNDPWPGNEPYKEMSLAGFRGLVETLGTELRYLTIGFTRNDVPGKDENRIEEMVKQRSPKKLRGDPAVYDKAPRYRLYGLKGLEAFKDDLAPTKFAGIMRAKARLATQGQVLRPIETVTYLNLHLYQYSFITSVSAEYLKATGETEAWRWLSNLHTLYEKLYVSSGKLVSIFKSSQDLDEALPKCAGTLSEMSGILDEIIDLSCTVHEHQ